MLELIIKSIAVIYIVRLVLKHNLFVSNLIIEINSKEKKHPSAND